jgi:hypothetical protein
VTIKSIGVFGPLALYFQKLKSRPGKSPNSHWANEWTPKPRLIRQPTSAEDHDSRSRREELVEDDVSKQGPVAQHGAQPTQSALWKARSNYFKIPGGSDPARAMPHLPAIFTDTLKLQLRVRSALGGQNDPGRAGLSSQDRSPTAVVAAKPETNAVIAVPDAVQMSEVARYNQQRKSRRPNKEMRGQATSSTTWALRQHGQYPLSGGNSGPPASRPAISSETTVALDARRTDSQKQVAGRSSEPGLSAHSGYFATTLPKRPESYDSSREGQPRYGSSRSEFAETQNDPIGNIGIEAGQNNASMASRPQSTVGELWLDTLSLRDWLHSYL